MSENKETATPKEPMAVTNTAAAQESFAVFAYSLKSSVFIFTAFSMAVFISSNEGTMDKIKAKIPYCVESSP